MSVFETSAAIILGVASGIITAIILGLLSLLFKKVFLPRFEDLVYKGVNISGSWIHKKQHPIQDFEIRMDIEQKAHRIWGKFQALSREGDKKNEYINYYKFSGIVKDNYMLVEYTALRKDRTGVGSFLLRVSRGGMELIGNAIFTPDGDKDDTKIVTRENMIFVKN